MHFHAVVWLDHRLARIIGFNLHDDWHSLQKVESHGPAHIHHKAGVIGSGHEHDAPAYFQSIADALNGVREILISGPAQTKSELVSFLRLHNPEVAVHVVGAEPMDQRSDGEIIEFARAFFKRADRMTPQR